MSFSQQYTKSDYKSDIQNISTVELLGLKESIELLALAVAEQPNQSREVAEIQHAEIVAELERRKRLIESRPDDPLNPGWPKPQRDTKQRIEAVKAAWPIEKFCTEILAANLIRTSRNRLKGQCPFLHHTDDTPSFTVYLDTDSAYCFGCGVGGDQIHLAGVMFGIESFFERLEMLERFARIVPESSFPPRHSHRESPRGERFSAHLQPAPFAPIRIVNGRVAS